MSTERATGNQSTGHDGGSIEAQLKSLQQRVEDLEQENQANEERIHELEDTVSEQQDTIEGLQDQVSENTEGIKKAKDSRGHIIGDIVGVEDRLEAIETQSDPNGTAVDQDAHAPAGSPLCQFTNLPEHMAEEQLESNKMRARFVAKDVQQYAEKRLGEWVLSSSDIRKVLSAKEERQIRWTTVHRVMEYLDTFGKNDTRLKDQYGKIVCFDPEAVKKYGNTQDDTANLTSVVSGGSTMP